MRLQKYLAEAGVASRRKCEELITSGRVMVNGKVAIIGMSVEMGDRVELDNTLINPPMVKEVYAFYKPKNVICTAAEDEDRVKVVDFFTDVPHRLYTVGRLDYDSEGLIFVTNDGEFADKLTHPRYVKNKTYRVLCSGELSKQEQRRLSNGVQLDDGMTAPAIVDIIRTGNQKTELLITIHEGRNRQIRRMLTAIGHDTIKLCRISIGGIALNGLKPGEKRLLSRDEIEDLMK